MKKFYAENDTRMEDGTGSVDLWRFNSKKERDEFVKSSDHATTITRKESEKSHQEQWGYWKNFGRPDER